MAGFRLRIPSFVWIVAAWIIALALMDPIERGRGYDARLALRRDHGWPAELVTVAIDDAALAAHGRWPWPRARLASFLERIHDLGAKTIVLDGDAASETDPADDAAYADAMPLLVLGVDYAPVSGGRTTTPETVRRFLLDEPQLSWAPKMKPSQLLAPIDAFGVRVRGLGHILIHVKSDGVVRGAIPFFGIEGEKGWLPSLAVAGLMDFEDVQPAQVVADDHSVRIAGGPVVPLHHGEVLLDLVPGGAMPPRLTAGEILDHDDGLDDAALRARLAGKLALVHVDSVAAPDTKASPLSPVTPGGLLQAYAIRTLQLGHEPIPVSSLLVTLPLLALVLLARGRLTRRPPQQVLAIAGIAAVAAMGVAVALVPIADVFLPIATPAAFLALSGAVIAGSAGRRAEAERSRLQTLLRAATAGGAELAPTKPIALADGGAADPEPTRPAAPASAPSASDEPVVIGRYVVQRPIGKGGMGAIFLAHDEELDRHVAIKVLESSGKEPFARFRREAMAVARISHPNVVQIHEIGWDAASPYIVMEYLPGGTMAELLTHPDAGLPLPWQRVTKLMIGVCSGLGAAHAAGIVHRDVKPSNMLMVSRSGDVAKMADFGIASLAGTERLTREGFFLGTIGYLSPEQATGGRITPASDVFSLGLTWYRMLTGRHAFDGTTAEILRRSITATVPDPRDISPLVPAEAVDLLRRMTAREPNDRPRDGFAAAAEMRRILGAS